VKGFVYDSAVLVAIDRNDRQTWLDHWVRLERGITPLVPAPVVAQVSRSPRQVPLRRFLKGCRVVPFAESEAHEAGLLLARARRSDVVDACVVALALRTGSVILTGDPADIEALAASSGRNVKIVSV
jgi:predicted nucleic acid-binding protein